MRLMSLLLLSIAGAIAPAWGQVTLHVHLACADPLTPPEERVKQCTLLIEQRGLSRQNLAIAYNNRGTGYESLGAAIKALDDFTRAIEFDPNYPTAYANRGRLHEAERRSAAALADFTRAIELDGQDARYYILRGRNLRLAKQPARAMEDFEQAIELDQRYAAAFIERGNAHVDLGNYPRAIADYDRAITLQPDDSQALNGSCFARAVLGTQLPEAMKHCHAALRLAPAVAAYYDSRGLALLNLGEIAAAVDDYASAVILNDREPHHLFGRGIARLRLGDKSGEDDLQVARTLDPVIDRTYAAYGIMP